MTDPTPADRLRAIALIDAAAWFTREGRMVQRLFGHQVAALLRRRADDADPMVGSLARDGFGADEIADMLRPEPAVVPPTNRASALTDAERTMLAYALDQAQERIWSEDGFTDADQAALDSLRRMAADRAAVTSAEERLGEELDAAAQTIANLTIQNRKLEEELRRMADETTTTEARCPSCDHEAKYHAADDGRCWFTVDHGVPGSNLVCPCCPRKPDADEVPAAEQRHADGDHGLCCRTDCETIRKRADEPEAPAEEQTVRAHVTTLHLIGEQLADIELWMWEHLADVRDAEAQQDTETPRPHALAEAPTVLRLRVLNEVIGRITGTQSSGDSATEDAPAWQVAAVLTEIRDEVAQQSAAGARQDGAQQESDNQRTVCVCGHTRGEHIRIGGPFGQGRLLCDTCDPDSTENLTCREFEAL